MGDSGAMFLGFTLAAISLLGVMKSTAAIALVVPLLIIGVPIFDTALGDHPAAAARPADPGGRHAATSTTGCSAAASTSARRC